MRITFISLCIILGTLALLFESNLLPTAFFPSTPSVDYTLSLLSTIITLGGVFFAIRLYKKEKQEATQIENNIEALRSAYDKWNTRRIAIIFSAAVTNLIIYYGGTFNESAMYNLIITLIGAVFCWPNKRP